MNFSLLVQPPDKKLAIQSQVRAAVRLWMRVILDCCSMARMTFVRRAVFRSGPHVRWECASWSAVLKDSGKFSHLGVTSHV
jgi:hypothetical protein